MEAKRKYVRVGESVTKAKCGHISKKGRYFKCEDCQPILEEDDGDLIYFQEGGQDDGGV